MIPITIEKAKPVLIYLEDGNVDRFYLNDFNNTESLSNSENKTPILIEEPIYHDKYYLLENIKDIIFKFSTVDMRGFNKLEIAIFSEEELNLDNVSLYFSEFACADIPLESAKLNFDETIVNGKLYQLVFDLKDKQGADYYLPNVNSIKLNLDMICSKVKVANIMIKTDGFNLTLDELKPALDNAEKYILKRIPDSNIPNILLDEVPKKAASMLWLVYRQGKGESNIGSEVGKFSNKNFHDKLKLEVDDAISDYIGEETSDDGKQSINTDLVGSI